MEAAAEIEAKDGTDDETARKLKPVVLPAGDVVVVLFHVPDAGEYPALFLFACRIAAVGQSVSYCPRS